MERILGVDLTQIPGLQAASIHTLFSEIGRDLSAFRSAKHFASWLGLCPDNRISGGKILSVKTRSVKNRAATVLRLAAQTLHRSSSALGNYYRRMRAKLGAPAAITATAHKLARIIYHLLTTGEPYDETVFARNDALVQERRLRRLQRDAAALGFALAPTGDPSVS
jgi:transposase